MASQNRYGGGELTSAGAMTLGDRRSIEGLEVMERGDRSTEGRAFCNGEGESASDLVPPLLILLTLGVVTEALPVGVSDRLDLLIVQGINKYGQCKAPSFHYTGASRTPNVLEAQMGIHYAPPDLLDK